MSTIGPGPGGVVSGHGWLRSPAVVDLEQSSVTSIGTVGLVVNPRSGTDVRRAVAAAGAVTVEDKVNVVRRVVLGAREAGILPGDLQLKC